jgi:hypothetical protein
MIGPAISASGAAQILVATKPVDFRKQADSLAALVQEALGADPFSAPSMCSGPGAPNHRHSAYRFRFATIAYRWHPLFGRKLQVSPFRRGKELTCIYTNERPDLCRELPNWMFDESYCSGMTLGAPEISIEGLNELAGVLASFGANRKGGAQSHPSKSNCSRLSMRMTGSSTAVSGIRSPLSINFTYRSVR